MSAELRKLALQLRAAGAIQAAEKTRNLANDPYMPESVDVAREAAGLPQNQENVEATYPPKIRYTWSTLDSANVKKVQTLMDTMRAPYVADNNILHIDCPEAEKPLFNLVFKEALDNLEQREDYQPTSDEIFSNPIADIVHPEIILRSTSKRMLGVSFLRHQNVSKIDFQHARRGLIQEANTILTSMQRNTIDQLAPPTE